MSQPVSDHNEAIALIIDTSTSDDLAFDRARNTAHNIYEEAGLNLEQLQFFKLGSAERIDPATLQDPIPIGVRQQSKTCSLIAPVMEKLLRDEQTRRVIIIGSGEIFDLDDWIDDPHVEGWLLVHTNERLLQGNGSRLSEIAWDEVIENQDTLLSYFSPVTRPAEDAPRRANYSGAYEWDVDASGYPLIYVEPLDAFVQLFPVTKPQFEKFIAADRPQGLDDEWYSGILSLNPRASYRSQVIPVMERLFMTGITTGEAISFARWMGRDYTLLSAEEWSKCYEWFAGKPAPSLPSELAERLGRDALALWNIVEEQWLAGRPQPDLQELSLMTRGILEWVIERTGKYCGLGEPASSDYQRKAFEPVRPLGPEPRRLKNLGFRLRTRKIA